MATGIGDTLRTAREERGLTLSDAAEETAISRRKLQALEDERFDVLEGDVYVKSSLRLYCRFLHIDPDPLVETYRQEFGEPVTTVPVQPVAQYRERISPVVTFAVVALVVVVGLAVIGTLNDGPGGGPVAVATAEPDAGDAAGPEPVASDQAAGGTSANGDVAQPTPAETAAPDPTARPLSEAEEVELALNVSGGASWVRITVDDEQVLERTLEDGFSETFTGGEIQMRIGNGGAADVVVNGEELADFSTGQVVDVTCAAGASSCTVE